MHLTPHTKKILFFCFKWVTFWVATIGLHTFLARGLNTVQYPISASYLVSYFIIAGLIAVIFFQVYEDFPLNKKNLKQVQWILVSFLIFLAANPFINIAFPLTPELKDHLLTKKLYFPLFYYTASTIKIADILFQQVLIFAFLKQANKIINNTQKTSYLFSFLFFCLHLPLFYFFKWDALIFVIPCIFAGYIFSQLHFRFKKRGLVLSFVVHELFYIFMGLIFRLSYWA